MKTSLIITSASALALAAPQSSMAASAQSQADTAVAIPFTLIKQTVSSSNTNTPGDTLPGLPHSDICGGPNIVCSMGVCCDLEKCWNCRVKPPFPVLVAHGAIHPGALDPIFGISTVTSVVTAVDTSEAVEISTVTSVVTAMSGSEDVVTKTITHVDLATAVPEAEDMKTYIVISTSSTTRTVYDTPAPTPYTGVVCPKYSTFCWAMENGIEIGRFDQYPPLECTFKDWFLGRWILVCVTHGNGE